MTDEAAIIDVMESRAKRREDRRDFFTRMGGAALMSGAAAISSTAADAQAVTDNDILNFALNLEYLEAQFYSFASFGTGLNNSMLTGSGTQGEVRGGRAVPFQDIVVRQYAREIAQDEIAHVNFLRTAIGATARVSQPVIDIRGGAGGPFAAAATAAGLPDGANFDPYADDNSFLLGAYIFEDVGVTAYKGAAPLLTAPGIIEAAAGLLAVEAYHAGLVRTVLYGKGVQVPELRTAADRISDARDSLDGTTERDQGISPSQGIPANAAASNIVPLDADGLAYSRTGAQVLNIVFLNRMAVTQGGFFPAGVNGPIRTSGAN